MKAFTFAAFTALLLVAPSAALAQQQGFIKSNVAKLIRKVGVHANDSFRATDYRDVI